MKTCRRFNSLMLLALLMGLLSIPFPVQAAEYEWTWMSGTSTVNQYGVYGTPGVPDAANVPGARYRSISWTGAAGDLWLFGGLGYATSGSIDNLNDLWRYDLPAPTAVTLTSFDAEWNGVDVVVTWETAIELNTLGFNVWRSRSGGAFEQVNAALILPAAPGSVMGGVYEFIDTGVPSSEDYAYKLEEVEIGGAVNWYGPVRLAANAPMAVSVRTFAAGSALWGVAPVLLAAVAVATLARRRQCASQSCEGHRGQQRIDSLFRAFMKRRRVTWTISNLLHIQRESGKMVA